MLKIACTLLILILAQWAPVLAQEVPHAFTGAKIIPVEGEPIEAGTLLVELSLIHI